jgi:two-component system nitrogen regulation sensor histidine kinase NtrY
MMAKRFALRSKTGLLVASVLVLVVTLALIMNWRNEEETFFSNIALFSLINLNILALIVLVVLVARNVIKLMFERKRGILGAKLRSRLVGSFVLIALIPMTLSFIVSSGLIHQAVQGWFNTQVESLVSSSLELARQYVAQAKSSVRGASRRIHGDLQRMGDWSLPNSDRVRQRLEDLRHSNDLYSLRIVTREGRLINEVTHSTASVESFAEPPVDLDAVSRVNINAPVLRLEEMGASQFVRVYQALGDAVLVSSYRMDPEMVHAQGVVNDAYNQYGDLKAVKDPLQTNFFSILALFNLMTLFGAIWVAFFISKQITGPIQVLAEGTRSIARGDYSFSLPQPIRDDEIGYLMASFNQMVRDLNSSQQEAERRGRLIEAIISNLGVGVVALDPDKRVTAVNKAARYLLDITCSEADLAGHQLCDVLPKERYSQLAQLVEALETLGGSENKAGTAEIELRLRRDSRELLVICTAGRIQASGDQSRAALGYVMLLDDVTELSRAQHLAAWRDVARRIAHEIKNPLTPLQLSAERLERLLKTTDASTAASESVRSIVEHVGIIKRLANEFSEYGRMPTAQFAPSDLEVMVRSAYQTFKDNNPEIDFSFTILNKTPEMLLDPEQIRGVLMNIFSNAVAAVRSQEGNTTSPAIRVAMDFDRSTARARIEIADSGPGIAASDKSRVFEPYFTTKKGGTGLGLAIVSSVISDHQGEISIFDNEPHGARFVITLPQHPQPSTLRKLGV